MNVGSSRIMLSFRRFVALSPACRCLVKRKIHSLKAANCTFEPNVFLLDGCTFSRYRYNQMRCLATDSKDFIDAKDIAKKAPDRERAKTPEAPKITLLDSRENITVCTMQEAEKIASSKKLRLVQVLDPKLKTQRPTYKLMSEAEYLEEDLREKQRVKEEKKKNLFVKGNKLLTISTRSTEHDIDIKLNKALKWFEKKYEIRVIILGNVENTKPQEDIYQKFEKTFKPIARIVQKRIKNGALKFQIIPPKREESEPESSNNDAEESSEISDEEKVHENREAVKESL